MKPLSAPRCVVATCLALAAVATGSPAATASTAPTPAPANESTWMNRLATAPGKLAFWKKEAPPAPAPETAPAPIALPTQKKAKAKATPPPAAAAAAATHPSAPGSPPETDKPSFLTRLPSLPNPFAKKSAPAPTPTPEKPAKENPGPTKPDSSIKPDASKKLAETKPKPAPAAEPAPRPPAKPSVWSRMASVVVPSKSAAPTAPAPSRRGSPQVAAVDSTTSTFVIAKDESPFYSFGPHQATPPDAYLSTGTVVTLQEKTWGWAQVQLSDGRSGTIARSALRPATAADLMPASLPPSLVAATTARRGGAAGSYVMPPVALPDLPTGATTPDSAAEAEELSSALLPPFAE